ncbi:UNVERIFIED_CONTAM: hypothetical protein HDU68_006265 [Siphonaria sp. JEL0065]|nr:hypothetical protein HDU68_006265 [Siphonaria sp. JEL0065]
MEQYFRRIPIPSLIRRRRLLAFLTVSIITFLFVSTSLRSWSLSKSPKNTTGTSKPSNPDTILYSNASIASVLKARANSKFNNFAIALKSGSETFAVRTPAQFDTFLDRALNVLVIGEANRDSLETGRKMVDVYHGALDEAKRRLGVEGVKFAEARRGKLKLVLDLDGMGTAGNGGNSADGKNGNDTVQAGWFQNEGWRSDAHKNLPGFALLYKTFPDADWFLMIDDDSFVIEKIHKPLTMRPAKTMKAAPCAPEISTLFNCWRALDVDAKPCAESAKALALCMAAPIKTAKASSASDINAKLAKLRRGKTL